jgi:hypothetical protein
MDRFATEEYHTLWVCLAHLTEDARFVPYYRGGKGDLFIQDLKGHTVFGHSSLSQQNVDVILQSTGVDIELYGMFVSVGLSIEAALLASLTYDT